VIALVNQAPIKLVNLELIKLLKSDTTSQQTRI